MLQQKSYMNQLATFALELIIMNTIFIIESTIQVWTSETGELLVCKQENHA